MTYKYYNTKKAFSLIEILMLVSIIGLLASIVLVNAGTYKKRAQRSAVLSEVGTLLRAVEICILENKTMHCGGSIDSKDSSVDCSGATASRPVRGTAICGAGGAFSENVWPNVEENGYRYAGYTGSAIARGEYTIGMIRDVNTDDVPDDGRVICCDNTGCQETDVVGNPGAFCRARAGMTGIED